MTPLERYRRELERPDFFEDPEQTRVIGHLQELYEALLDTGEAASDGSLLARLGLRRRGPRAPVTGLYLWGGVGRGKTWLVDLFFECLPFQDKQRTHFHRFMRKVHQELKALREQRDPLEIVAERFAGDTRILCFDEFVVNDITDAMILGGLLDKLFARGVTLVATSNTAPDDLYRDGLQRDRFEPAIELIKAHTRVLHVQGEIDYRLQFLETAQTWLVPPGAGAERSLSHDFEHVAPEAGERDAPLEIEGRRLRTRRLADGVVWFDFAELCGGPRSQNDYIELASCFHTVLVSGIPVFDEDGNDQARRFINLVDVLYDRRVTLIASAEAPPDELYRGKRLAMEFQRTASRLVEMQSRQYLSLTHLA
ncbi:MAG TPA: cell division protein ZapE [Arenicellales bacterium]|nr:cell division protein ZapE [Arenicellales bacterium]